MLDTMTPILKVKELRWREVNFKVSQNVSGVIWLLGWVRVEWEKQNQVNSKVIRLLARCVSRKTGISPQAGAQRVTCPDVWVVTQLSLKGYLMAASCQGQFGKIPWLFLIWKPPVPHQGQGCEPIMSCAFPVKVKDWTWLSLMSPEWQGRSKILYLPVPPKIQNSIERI